MKFDDGKGKSNKYEVEAIRNGAIYIRELERGHLLGLYYLILWKDYSKEEIIWEPASIIQYL